MQRKAVIFLGMISVVFFMHSLGAAAEKVYNRAYLMILPHQPLNSTVEFRTQGCQKDLNKVIGQTAWSTVIPLPSKGCMGKIVKQNNASEVVATLVFSSDIHQTKVMPQANYNVTYDDPADIAGGIAEYALNVSFNLK